jgi:manganese transport protein
VLSMQLPFAVIPLVSFTSNRAKMGNFVNPAWLKWAAWTIAAVIVGLNLKLLASFFGIA